MTPGELTRRINRINKHNDFDLAWRWDGDGEVPTIVIYEEADRHELTSGTLDDIEERLVKYLPSWGLEDDPEEES